jgi:hypothetical protein
MTGVIAILIFKKATHPNAFIVLSDHFNEEPKPRRNESFVQFAFYPHDLRSIVVMRLYIFHRLWMFFILRYTQKLLGVLLNPEWVRRSAAGARTLPEPPPTRSLGMAAAFSASAPVSWPGVLARCLGPVSWRPSRR